MNPLAQHITRGLEAIGRVQMHVNAGEVDLGVPGAIEMLDIIADLKIALTVEMADAAADRAERFALRVCPVMRAGVN